MSPMGEKFDPNVHNALFEGAPPWGCTGRAGRVCAHSHAHFHSCAPLAAPADPSKDPGTIMHVASAGARCPAAARLCDARTRRVGRRAQGSCCTADACAQPAWVLCPSRPREQAFASCMGSDRREAGRGALRARVQTRRRRVRKSRGPGSISSGCVALAAPRQCAPCAPVLRAPRACTSASASGGRAGARRAGVQDARCAQQHETLALVNKSCDF
jgi:hypothetical protein